MMFGGGIFGKWLHVIRPSEWRPHDWNITGVWSHFFISQQWRMLTTKTISGVTKASDPKLHWERLFPLQVNCLRYFIIAMTSWLVQFITTYYTADTGSGTGSLGLQLGNPLLPKVHDRPGKQSGVTQLRGKSGPSCLCGWHNRGWQDMRSRIFLGLLLW